MIYRSYLCCYPIALSYTMLRIAFVSLLIITLGSCNSKPKQQARYKRPNLVSSELLADSILLEVVQKGDTVIKHYTDLRGTGGDGFDNTDDEVCTYQQFYTDTTLPLDFYIHHIESRFKIYMDRKQVIAHCDSVLKTFP